MDIETIISSVVISAAVSGICGIITALISKRSAKRVAEETTRGELEILHETWARDDKVLRDKAFNEMVDAVARYIQTSRITDQEDARAKTAVALVHCRGELADKLRALDASLKPRPTRIADVCLKAAIACKKKMDAQKSER